MVNAMAYCNGILKIYFRLWRAHVLCAVKGAWIAFSMGLWLPQWAQQLVPTLHQQRI
jgi:hypothetical protein